MLSTSTLYSYRVLTVTEKKKTVSAVQYCSCCLPPSLRASNILNGLDPERKLLRSGVMTTTTIAQRLEPCLSRRTRIDCQQHHQRMHRTIVTPYGTVHYCVMMLSCARQQVQYNPTRNGQPLSSWQYSVAWFWRRHMIDTITILYYCTVYHLLQ